MRVDKFEEIAQEVAAYIGSTNYATMTTVDAKNRPRARVLIPVWEVSDQLVGWLATYKTQVKTAHLARNPHATFSYWSPRQNAAAIDVVTRWRDDRSTKEHVWQLYSATSPPGAGYDLGRFWTDPGDPKLHVLQLQPWRVQVTRGFDLRTRIWRTTDQRMEQSQPGTSAPAVTT